MTKEMKNEYVEDAGTMLANADRVVLIHRIQSPRMRAEVNAIFKAFCMSHKIYDSDKLMVTDLLMKEFGYTNDSIRDKNIVNMYLPDIMCEIHNIGIGKGETFENSISTKNHHLFHKINEACQTLIGRPKNSDDITWQTILKNSCSNDNTLFIITGMKFSMETVVQINLLLSKHENASVIILMPSYNASAIAEELLKSPHANRMIIQLDTCSYDIRLNKLFNQSYIYDNGEYELIHELLISNGWHKKDTEYGQIYKIISDTMHDKSTAYYNYESILTDLYLLAMNSKSNNITQEAVRRLVTLRETYDNRFSKITHLNLIKTRQRKFDKFIQPYIKAYNFGVKSFKKGSSIMNLTGSFLVDILLEGSLTYREVSTEEILFIPSIYIEDDEAYWMNSLSSQYGYKVIVTFDLINSCKMNVVAMDDDIDLDEFILNTMLISPSINYGRGCKMPSSTINEEIRKFKIKNRSMIELLKYWAFVDGTDIVVLNQNDDRCQSYAIGIHIKTVVSDFGVCAPMTTRNVSFMINHTNLK